MHAGSLVGVSSCIEAHNWKLVQEAGPYHPLSAQGAEVQAQKPIDWTSAGEPLFVLTRLGGGGRWAFFFP